MLDAYYEMEKERAKAGLPPLPLTPPEVEEVCQGLESADPAGGAKLRGLLENRVAPGVDPAAKVKAGWLAAVAKGTVKSPAVSRQDAVRILGTMLGGYNVDPLVEALADPAIAAAAAEALKRTVLVYGRFETVADLAATNPHAKSVLGSWAAGEWFLSRPEFPAKLTLKVFKVDGEINTDDFSPAGHAPTRPDIPLHAQSMGEKRFPGGNGVMKTFREEGHRVAFVADVVGTGSSRKSACNSLMWHIGEDIPFVPNKRRAGVVIGGLIAPIFFNTTEDSGGLPLMADVTRMKTGDVITLDFAAGAILDAAGRAISKLEVKPPTLKDEFRAGGRLALIIGRQLTARARQTLGLGEAPFFTTVENPKPKPDQGYTLAQKIVGRACGVAGRPARHGLRAPHDHGRLPGHDRADDRRRAQGAGLPRVPGRPVHAVVLPHGRLSQAGRRQGPSNAAGLHDRPQGRLAQARRRGHPLLAEPAHPARYGRARAATPTPVSRSACRSRPARAWSPSPGPWASCPSTCPNRSWSNSADSCNPGITLRDVVNAIPYFAVKQGMLTVEKKNKKNVFNGCVLEIEGLEDLTGDQAYELTDASAERSAAACVISLSEERVADYLKSNVALMEEMIKEGYQSADTLRRRIDACRAWLAKPTLLRRDAHAEYKAVLEIDLAAITEPLVACPNDPDDVRPLSAIAGDPVQEVFIGSCMTNIGQFRAAARILDKAGIPAAKVWITPPTKMDAAQLMREGYYADLRRASAAGPRCPGAPCAWATRPGSPPERRSSPPRRGISTTGWATTPASTSAPRSWPP